MVGNATNELDGAVRAPVRRRADGERSRTRILAAARVVIAAPGAASMHAVAQHAGVGQATLYRHFSTWESLVLAVYREEFDAVVEAAPRYAAQPGLDGLRSWLIDLADCGRTTAELSEALLTTSVMSLCDRGYQPVVDAIDLLLDAARARGEVTADLDGAALLVLVGFLWRIDPEPADLRTRLLDVVIGGL